MYLEPQVTPNTSRPTTSPIRSNSATALDWFSPPVFLNSYRYKLTFVYFIVEKTGDSLFRINWHLCWIAYINLWENVLIPHDAFPCYPSKALDEFQGCCVWLLLNFSVLGYYLAIFKNNWTSFWFVLFMSFFFHLVFSVCFCFIFSRFWQASTQCLSSRSPTAQLVICVKGSRSSLCWSSNIPVCWRMTLTKETRGL